MAAERGDILKMSSNFSIDCTENVSPSYKWSIHRVDIDTMSETEFFLSNNPDLYQDTLIITGGRLGFGYHKISLYTLVTVDTKNRKNINNQFSATDYAYIRVIPTGIAVFCFDNYNKRFEIGSSQSLVLNPLTYSYDMDFLIDISSLQFKFFCFGINKTQPFPIDKNYFDLKNTVDLKQSQMINSKNECFDSRNGYSFDSTNNILTIEPGGLRINSLRENIFVISTNYFNTFYVQYFIVERLKQNIIPIPSVK